MSADHIHNLENTDFSNWNERLNSPKSIEACRKSGVEPKDLYQIPFEDFVSHNPEIKNLPREYQILRYSFYEKTRMENIKTCREERLNFIDGYRKFEESQFQRSFALSQTSKSVGLPGLNVKTSSIDTEQKSIEKLKQRQKTEVENVIDQELKLEMLRKENEQKEFLARIKEEKLKEALKKKKLIQEEKKRQRDMMKQYQTEKEYEELQRRLIFKQQEEQMKKDFIAEKQSRKQYEMMMRKEAQIQKTREKKMSCERMFQDNQRRIVQKQIMMEERENFRKAWENQKNSEKKFEKDKIRDYQQGRIHQVKEMMEYKIYRQQQELERKELQIQQRRKFFEMQHKLANKSENFQTSTSDIDAQSKTMPGKINKLKFAKMKNEWEQMMKSSSIISKLDQVDQKIKMKHHQTEQMLMFKNEIKAIKREEFKNNLKKQEKINEYYRELNMRKLREKEERALLLKKNNMEMLMYKKSIQEDNSKQKKQVMDLFEKMMKNSNSISPEIILQMFPGEQKLINKLMMLKEVTRSISPSRSQMGTEENMWNNPTYNLNNSF